MYGHISNVCFVASKGDDAKEDNTNQESDKIVEDGNDTKNGENEKSAEDVWSTDFAVSNQIFFSFVIKVMYVLFFNYAVWNSM